MCGLVGAFRANGAMFPVSVKNFLTQGLYVSALRGMGGCGVGIVDTGWEIDMVKTHVDAGNFVFTDKYDWVSDAADKSRVILGHTRAPTGSAGISSKNAHPFWYGDSKKKDSVIGIHNGHIQNYYSLTPQGFVHPVDSAHAIYSIYQNGALETLKKILGYYVLIWYNQKDKTLNMARNTHRELYLARNMEKTIIYYASEEEILKFALERNKIAYDPKYGTEGFAELDPFKLYSWPLEENTVAQAYVTDYEEKKEKTYGGGTKYGGADHWNGNSNSSSSVLMKLGSEFFAEIKDPTKAWQQYETGSEGWGRVFGRRRMDDGLVVIEGVNKKEWDTKWIHLADALPCSCTKADYESHGEGAAKKTYPSYAAILNKKSAERDYKNWMTGQTQLKELEKKGNTSPRSNENSSVGSNKSTSTDLAVSVLVEGPDKKLIPQSEWLKMARESCVVCRGSITIMDVGKVLFFPWNRNPEDSPEDTEYQMVCPVCVGNPEDVQRALGYIPL